MESTNTTGVEAFANAFAARVAALPAEHQRLALALPEHAVRGGSDVKGFDEYLVPPPVPTPKPYSPPPGTGDKVKKIVVDMLKDSGTFVMK